MIPGSHPMHVIKDDTEHTSDAMANPEVRWTAEALWFRDAGRLPAEVEFTPVISFGTTMTALQMGQVISFPA